MKREIDCDVCLLICYWLIFISFGILFILVVFFLLNVYNFCKEIDKVKLEICFLVLRNDKGVLWLYDDYIVRF